MGNTTGMLTAFLPLVLFFVIMWFFLIRPQNKKDKEARDMRNNLSPGDEVTTIGGIVGTVMNVKEDSVVLYCGSDRVKLEFKKVAIAEVTAKKGEPKKEQLKETAKSAPAEEKSSDKAEENAPKFRKLERKEDEKK
jgi:preprotein translocase subunit YajC